MLKKKLNRIICIPNAIAIIAGNINLRVDSILSSEINPVYNKTLPKRVKRAPKMRPLSKLK